MFKFMFLCPSAASFIKKHFFLIFLSDKIIFKIFLSDKIILNQGLYNSTDNQIFDLNK